MKKGFTLVELMIVIVIIALLAMIAVPSFMSCVAKAKRTEAYMNLSSLYSAQKAYWAEHGTYSAVLCGQGGIGWKPEGYKTDGSAQNFNYTYGFGNGSEGTHFFTGKLGAPAQQLQQAHAGKDSFLILAVADIDGDGKFDVLGVNQFNEIKVLEDDLL